jgi:hypothetical protein
VREFADPPSPTLRHGKQRSEVRSHAGRSNTKLDRFAFGLTSKKTKRLAASTVSIHQALNC